MMKFSGCHRKAIKRITMTALFLVALISGWLVMQSESTEKRLSFLSKASTFPMAEADDPQFRQASKQREVLSQRGEMKHSHPTDSGLAKYPDEPLKTIPPTPMSPEFLVEHRTALRGKAVTVRGVVVRTGFAEKTGAASGATPSPGAHPQPRLFLANDAKEERDKNYDLMVLLGEEDEDYATGETAEIKGIVESSKVAIYLRKID